MLILYNGDGYRFENVENQFLIDIPDKTLYLLAMKTSDLTYLSC
jgi:hypothetical protein